MYCSICGATIPKNRSSCDTCGTPAHRVENVPARNGTEPVVNDLDVADGGIRSCPRCDYQGQGLPYFTRGPHMAALIGATLFTLPYALGAGGFLYYGMRHDHKVCPRCGQGWGRRGEAAFERQVRHNRLVPDTRHLPAVTGDGLKRAWSIILFGLAAALLAAGAVQMEVLMLVLGILATTGAIFLHRAANEAREERRAALVAAMQMPVLKLAAEREGRLTVTETAASLGWSLRRAEKVLHSLDDGWRVTSEVTDEGVIVYEFREILLGPGRRDSDV